MQVNKLDWLVFNAALLVTMFAGVDIGLGVSIGLSIVLALYKSAFPKTSILGRLPETTVYRYAAADNSLADRLWVCRWQNRSGSSPDDHLSLHRIMPPFFMRSA